MKLNKSVTRILAILELLSHHPEGLTLGEIYRSLDMPKATAYDFLQTLYHADAVYYKDPRLKNYVIGAKMYSIGAVYTRGSNLIDASDVKLRDFATKYGQTVFITKQYENKIVYVYKYKADNAIISVPLTTGDITTNQTNDITHDTYAYYQKRNTTVFNLFAGAINNLPYISALSVPIFNFENKCVGTLLTCDFSDKNSHNREVKEAFINIAKHVSQKLGYLQGDSKL